jgi:hypothetical protein
LFLSCFYLVFSAPQTLAQQGFQRLSVDKMPVKCGQNAGQVWTKCRSSVRQNIS